MLGHKYLLKHLSLINKQNCWLILLAYENCKIADRLIKKPECFGTSGLDSTKGKKNQCLLLKKMARSIYCIPVTYRHNVKTNDARARTHTHTISLPKDRERDGGEGQE